MTQSKSSYELTLNVTEFGQTRSFSANGSSVDQVEMARSLANDVGRAVVSTMECPCNEWDLIGGRIGSSAREKLGALYYAHRYLWSYEANFDDCIDITVDIDKLMEGGLEEINADFFITLCRLAGVKVMRNGNTMDCDESKDTQ